VKSEFDKVWEGESTCHAAAEEGTRNRPTNITHGKRREPKETFDLMFFAMILPLPDAD